jgi:carboxymethylenebutenolidase
VKPSPDGVPGAVTDPTGVLGEDILFPGSSGDPINGYLATPVGPANAGRPTRAAGHGGPVGSTGGTGPSGAAGRPAIVVIHEAGGLGEHIRDVVNRFANLGYVSLGVDLYTREGGPPPMDDLNAMMDRLFSMSDHTVLGDLKGAADHLRAREDVSGKVGCIGFCMGGRYTLLLACSSNRLDAAVDCWGGFIDTATLEDRSTPTRPTPPLELAESLSCPLMVAVGAEDHNPSPAVASQLRERARRSPIGVSGGEVTVDVYEDAGHAFFADYRPSYRPGPAAKLWERVVPFFARHLG